MPMTPQGYVPPKTGEYQIELICSGLPRCARIGRLRRLAQDEGCSMCRKEYVYVENEK